ncbi:Pirin-like protein [Gilbertella persicaria]|uniref:Pirin-like protein n=1 Tax=Gilbertella persicaria TaxID=101096 RepID=UPI00221FC107|nr:Pirin-like protein [Gilbertella persicaria]KAI8062774.1 Pirin-like protein [Gilbertella persicaria]
MSFRIARNISQHIFPTEKIEGNGARIYRSIGIRSLRNLDPFLLFDEFYIEEPGGFPPHPHRGFETVTYLLEGKIQHRDFKGHQGLIGPGDLQWMTAGKGIVHTELAASQKVHGLQLWVNLSHRHKMMDPQYQEISKHRLTHVAPEPGIDINVLAGSFQGASSPILTRTPMIFVDVQLKEKGKQLEQAIPADFNGFIYPLKGSVKFGDVVTLDGTRQMLVLSQNGGTYVSVKSLSDDARFIMVAGKPLCEPVVQYGMFAMNTQKEVFKAQEDFEHGRFGFEQALEWINANK